MYVHDLESFVTVQILEDALAAPSLGKLCEDHGYSCEWTRGQKPHFTKVDRKIQCNTKKNSVPIFVAGYQPVLPVRLQVRLPHGCRRTRLMMHRQLQQQHDVEVQVFQYWETSCDIRQRPKTQIKRRTPYWYRETCFARMVRGVHSKSRRPRSASIKGHTRKHFS